MNTFLRVLLLYKEIKSFWFHCLVLFRRARGSFGVLVFELHHQCLLWVLKCCAKLSLLLNFLSQNLHGNGLILEWTDLMCLFKCSERLNAFGQSSHLKGFSASSFIRCAVVEVVVVEVVEDDLSESMDGELDALFCMLLWPLIKDLVESEEELFAFAEPEDAGGDIEDVARLELDPAVEFRLRFAGDTDELRLRLLAELWRTSDEFRLIFDFNESSEGIILLRWTGLDISESDFLLLVVELLTNLGVEDVVNEFFLSYFLVV